MRESDGAKLTTVGLPSVGLPVGVVAPDPTKLIIDELELRERETYGRGVGAFSSSVSG